MSTIITISGEPASGKSSVVKKLQEYFEAEGKEVETILVGDLYRIRYIEEYKKIYSSSDEITITEIQADPKFKHIIDKIDKEVDDEITRKGNEILANEKDKNKIYIIDSRLGARNIPNSYRIRLVVDPNVAGQRVYSDTARGVSDAYASVEEAISQTMLRKKMELERYIEKYDYNLSDPNNYDLIIDTSDISIEEVASKIQDEMNVSTRNMFAKYIGTNAKDLMQKSFAYAENFRSQKRNLINSIKGIFGKEKNK